MKKYLISILCLLLITMGLVFSSQNEKKQDRLIVTSFYPVYIAALNVTDGVQGLTIKNLTSENVGCVHDYTLTPQDMIKLSTAEALVVNGSGMENFISNVVQNYPAIPIIDISSNVRELEAAHDHVHNDEHLQDSEHINSHTFVSIENHIVQVNNLANELANLDAENADIYLQNAEVYTNKLRSLKKNISNKLKDYKNEKIIALHESFSYFALDFELDVVDVIEIEEGQTMSAQDVANITQHIRKYNVKIIALEQNYESSIANSIAKDTNTITFIFDPVVSGEIDKNSYITKMENNLNNILLALKAGE